MAVGTLIPAIQRQWFGADGKPLSGGRIHSYLAGTTTPAPVYVDVGLTIPHGNPVILNASGWPLLGPSIFLSPTSYKFEIRTSGGVLVGDPIDNIAATPASEIDLDVPLTAGEDLAARDAVFIADGTGGTTAGRVYKTDADVVARSTGANIIGIAPAAIAAGATGAIRLQGRVTGFSGLTPGASYFVSAVAGAITAIAPVNARFIGVADTTTSFVLTVSGTAAALPANPIFGTVAITNTGASALDVGGGIVAGTGNVQVVDATGKIPAIDATRFASLSGANLTALNASAIASGTINEVHIPLTFIFSRTFDMSGSAAMNFIADGAAFAINVRGRAADSLGILRFMNNLATVEYGRLLGSTAGIDASGNWGFTAAQRLTGVISPPQLTADVNDYNPAGLSTARIIRIDASGGDAVHNLTGLSAQPAGTILSITVIGGSLTFVIESGSSTAANRFAFQKTIAAGSTESGMAIWYDATSGRWRQVG